MSNPIRDPTDDLPAVTEQLTQFQDGEARSTVEHEGQKHADLWEGNSNFPDQQLGVVLSRNYVIDAFDWNTQLGLIRQFQFPQQLCAIPQITDKTRQFRYFRAKGVKIGVRVNTTAFHYGRMCISHVIGQTDYAPSGGIASWAHDTTPEQRYQNKPVLISAMDAEVVEYTIPWHTQWGWLPIQPNGSIETFAMARMARVSLDVLVPLGFVNGATPTADVTIFANFIEPELQGPRVSHFADTETYIPQMSTEAIGKAIDGVLSGHESVGDGIMATLSAAAPLLEVAAILDKPTTMSAPVYVESAPGRDMAFGSGIDNANKLSLHPDAALATTPGIIDAGSGNFSVLEICKTPGYLGQFVIDKSRARDTPIGTLNNSPTTKLFPNEAGRNNQWDPDGINQVTYLKNVASMFKYWRGSLKYLMVFTCSKFVSTRMRICYFPPGVPVPAEGDLKLGTRGDFWSKVYDISGDTIINLEVPFLYEYMYANVGAMSETTGQGPSIGSLLFFLENRIVTTDSAGDSSIYCDIWQYAGDDFQLGFYTGIPFNEDLANDSNWGWTLYSSPLGPEPGENPDIQENKARTTLQPRKRKKRSPHIPKGDTYTPQCSIHEQAALPAEPIVAHTQVMEQGFSQPEKQQNITDLWKRYTRCRQWELNVTNVSRSFPYMIFDGAGEWTEGTQTSIYFLLSMFVYRRGSVRAKIFRPKAVNSDPWGVFITAANLNVNASSWGGGGGGYITAGAPADFLEFEIPYYAAVPYRNVQVTDTRFTMQNQYWHAYNVEDGLDTYWAVGDDFQVGGLFSPLLWKKQTPGP